MFMSTAIFVNDLGHTLMVPTVCHHERYRLSEVAPVASPPHREQKHILELLYIIDLHQLPQPSVMQILYPSRAIGSIV